MAEVLVRLLGPNDLALLSTPADDVFDAAIIPSLAAETLGDPRHHLVGAIVDGRLIGFASSVHYVHPDKPAQMFVNEVGVSAAWQRQGIGRRLVEALLAHGRRLGCAEAWVLTDDDNGAARALYAAGGGEEAPTHIFVFRLGG